MSSPPPSSTLPSTEFRLALEKHYADHQPTIDHQGHLVRMIPKTARELAVQVCPPSRGALLKSFDLLQRLNGGRHTTEPLSFVFGACSFCGRSPAYETLNGSTWKAALSCDWQEELPIRAEIDVSSGTLLFAKDVRELLSPPPSGGWEQEERRVLGGRAAGSRAGLAALLRLYAIEGALWLPIRSHASLLPANGGWDLFNPGLAGLVKPQPGRVSLVSGSSILMAVDSTLAGPFPSFFANAQKLSCPPGRYRLDLDPKAYEGPGGPLTYAHLKQAEE